MSDRGWDIEDSYTPHALDDPEHDVARDTEGVGVASILLPILAVALAIGTYLVGQTFQPPQPKFVLTPPQPIAVYVADRNPLQACGHLPACPAGRLCTIDPTCTIVVH